MYTLFIDTHSNKIVIILYKEDKIVVKKEIATHFDHSLSTIPTLIETMEEAKVKIEEVNQLIVVNGPGSFTGVRIGVTIAKTLAFTLKIPIKVVSSLLIKAVSFEHQEVNIIEKEKNGVFLGTFDKENNLIRTYSYKNNREYQEQKDKIDYKEDIEIDYEKVIKYANKLEAINPHAVNPLYVKKIEVEK